MAELELTPPDAHWGIYDNALGVLQFHQNNGEGLYVCNQLETHSAHNGHGLPPVESGRVFARFDDLSGIPSGATIVDARFKVYDVHHDLGGSFDLHRVTEDWTTGFDWATQPAYDGTPSGNIVSEAVEGWIISSNIKDLVNAWWKGTQDNYGLAIVDNNTPNTTSLCLDDSGDNPMKLVITYTYLQKVQTVIIG